MEGSMTDVTLVVISILIGCLVAQSSSLIGQRSGLALVNAPVGGMAGRTKTISLPDGSSHLISEFLGIPYAEPPTGHRRFMKPIKKSHLGRFFKADTESKACPQNPLILKSWVPGPEDMSEDCLKLNVYVPERNRFTACGTNSRTNTSDCPLKPVMIWIHGGAFLIGQSRIYNGERLAVYGDVIVVTINYRLGPLGFLSTGDGVVRGNAGLWDQSEAIDWVHENIPSFGGDPNRVTVFGESAGASSAIFQAMYPGNSGKMQRVIASSGTTLCPWTFSDEPTAKYTLRLAKRMGCVPDGFPGFSVAMHRVMIACLQMKPFQEIIGNSSVGGLDETLFRAEFVPIADGEFISSSPKSLLPWKNYDLRNLSSENDAILRMFSSMDVLIGNNENDGEAIARISVRGYFNTTSGVSFDDDESINSSIVNTVYVPRILKDFYGKNNNRYIDKQLLSEIDHVYYYGEDVINVTNLPLYKIGPQRRHLALKRILDLTTDYEFLMPTIQSITSLASYKAQKRRYQSSKLLSPTSSSSSSKSRHFLFLFDRKYPYLCRPDWIEHASHGDDLPYIFGFPQSLSEAFHITDDIVEDEWNISKTIMTYWTNFAKTGDPNLPNTVPTQWKEFDPQETNYLYIKGNMTGTNARQHLFDDRVKLWRDLLSDF